MANSNIILLIIIRPINLEELLKYPEPNFRLNKTIHGLMLTNTIEN